MSTRFLILLLFPCYCYGQKIPKTEKDLRDTMDFSSYYELKNKLETVVKQGLTNDTLIHCNRMDTVYRLLTLYPDFNGIIYSTNDAQKIIELNMIRHKNVVQLKACFSNQGVLSQLVYPVGNNKWSELHFYDNHKISLYWQTSGAMLFYHSPGFLGDKMRPGMTAQFFENGRTWLYYYWAPKPNNKHVRRLYFPNGKLKQKIISEGELIKGWQYYKNGFLRSKFTSKNGKLKTRGKKWDADY